jgi:Tol biopolymer transport system component
MRHSVAPKGATMNRLASLVAVALAGSVLAVLAGVSLTESAATTPGRNGRIVYAQEVRGTFQLFTIRSNGTARAKLGDLTGEAVHPDWSPDGTKVVFELDHPHGPAPFCAVELMNADGTGLTDLTGVRTGCEGQPAFTPDGQRIVFVRFDDAADVESIQSMDLTGGDRRLVTGTKGSGHTDPNVSPDGHWITFIRSKKEGVLQAVFAVHPDGSGLHQLTPFRLEVAIKHDWSPNGKRIVLTTNADFVRPRKSANLVTIRPDGSGLKRLTRFAGGEHAKNAFAGSYSPDGRRIVFRLEKHDKAALATIGRDGRHLRLLTKFRNNKPRYIDWGTAR